MLSKFVFGQGVPFLRTDRRCLYQRNKHRMVCLGWSFFLFDVAPRAYDPRCLFLVPRISVLHSEPKKVGKCECLLPGFPRGFGLLTEQLRRMRTRTLLPCTSYLQKQHSRIAHNHESEIFLSGEIMIASFKRFSFAPLP